MFHDWPIRRQLSILVLAILLPVASGIAYDLYKYWNSALDDATGQARNIADRTAEELGNVIRDHEDLLARLAGRPLIRAMDARRCDPIIAELATLNPDYYGLAVRDSRGQSTCAIAGGPTTTEVATDQPWFREAVANGGFSVANAAVGPANGRWVSLLNYPIFDQQGAPSGLLVLAVDLARLRQRVLFSVPKDAVVAVIGRDNKFLLRSRDHEQWVGKETGALALIDEARRLRQGVARVPGADGVNRVYAYQTIAGTGWLVTAGLPEGVVLAPARQRLVRGIELTLAAITLALALAFWISRRIAAPIRAIEQSAHAVAGGDLAARAVEAGPREIAITAREFNRMLDQRASTEAHLRETERRYRTMLDSVELVSVMLDRAGRITYCNDFLLKLTGWRREELLGQHAVEMLVPPEYRAEVSGLVDVALASGEQPRPAVREMLTKSGARRLIHWNHSTLRSSTGEIAGTASIGEDITERKRAEALLREERAALELIGSDAPLPTILDAITHSVEALSAGTLCSVLLLDAEGLHLQLGAAASLPDEFNREIDGAPIGPAAGSCGTASYRNEMVIVSDIATDPLWTDYAALALRHELRACWSTPVRCAAGKVLGTFAMYYRHPCAPGPAEIELIERWTHLVGIAIERKQGQVENARQLEELRRWYHATLGREERIGALKREVNALSARLGEPTHYSNEEAP